MHVKHSYRGDLVISLIGPSGKVYKLKAANDTDDKANVDAVYTVNLSGENRNGLWKLQVRDAYAGDAGSLASWSVTL